MPDPTAPVTGDLRDRFRHAIRAAGREIDENALTAIISELEGLLPLGDLPERVEAELAKAWPHLAGDAFLEQVALIALSVRWPAGAVLAAENARLRAERDHAEGELSAAREHGTRWETEKARADKAEAERDRIDEARRLDVKWRQAAEAQVAALQRELAEAKEAYRAVIEAAELRSAIELVRADAIEQRRTTGVTKDPWKLGVYAQACRTLRIVNAALDAHPDGPEEIRLAQATTEETNDG